MMGTLLRMIKDTTYSDTTYRVMGTSSRVMEDITYSDGGHDGNTA